MFLGTYAPRLDDKSRLVLPAKFRDQLADGVVITKGHERCLCVWPLTEFRSVTEQLRRAPVTSKGAGTTCGCCSPAPATRSPTSRAASPSRPGCATTPGWSATCAVIGANHRVEIWDAAAWEHYLAGQEETFSTLSQEVLPGIL